MTILNNDNGCEESAFVDVIEDAEFPNVVVAQPLNIDCDNTQVLLDGTASDAGPGIEYIWTDESGAQIGASPSIQVDAGGTFILEVNNTLTGCRETEPVTVMDLREDPIADPGAIQNLNCDNTTVTLGGDDLSLGSEFTYEWTLVGGGVISTSANPEISEGGEYILVVTNTTNNCTDMQSVETVSYTHLTLPTKRIV